MSDESNLPDPDRYEDPADEMVRKLERGIVEFLISAALSDHLGDIRDAEHHLWEALGYTGRSPLRDEMRGSEDYDSVFRPTRRLLIKGGYFDYMPDYAQEEHDDDE